MSDLDLDEVDQYNENRLKLSATNRLSEGYSEDDLSEDEVLGLGEDENISGSSDEDDDEAFGANKVGAKAEEEDNDDENWGGKENIYGGDDLDAINNKEEANELVKESIRLQKKHMDDLNMDDFVDEEMLSEWKKTATDYDQSATDAKSAVKQSQRQLQEVILGNRFVKLDSEAKKDFITSVFPEYFPLCKEFAELYNGTYQQLSQLKNQSKINKVKFVALSAYLSAIANYLNILVSMVKNSEDDNLTMKDHPIMETILGSREAWRQASELKNVSDKDLEQDDDEEEFKEDKEEDFASDPVKTTEWNVSDEELSNGELRNSDMSDDNEQVNSKDEHDLDLSKVKHNFVKRFVKVNDAIEGDIDDVDADEKKSRKKSLRFYTSKIDQQSNKKDARFAGDEDLPYKERLFERQQRLIEEARKRGLDKSDKATNLDNDDYDSADEQKLAQQINSSSTNDYDAFYNSVKFAKEDKQNKRKQAHKQAVKAAKEGKLADIMADENIGNDGKRAINYQILKNKGLTAKRKKETQNSRVKKRKKYEQAQKKLKSVRQVFKGQQGAYGGESTGIKKNLSRSVKLK